MAQNGEGDRLEDREGCEDRYVRVPLAVSTPVKHAISLSLPAASAVGCKTSPAPNTDPCTTNPKHPHAYLKSIATPEDAAQTNQENKTNILKSSLTESVEESPVEEDHGIGGDLLRVSFRNSGTDDAISIEVPERKSPPKEMSPPGGAENGMNGQTDRRGSSGVLEGARGAVGGPVGSVVRNLNGEFDKVTVSAPSAKPGSSASLAVTHNQVERRSSLNGPVVGSEKEKDLLQADSSKPRKIHRTRSLEKPRDSGLLEPEVVRERKFSLDDRRQLSTSASSPANGVPKITDRGADITEEDESEHLEGATGPDVAQGKDLLAVPGNELNASSRSVNEIEYNNSGPGVHRLHGSSPDLGSIYTAGSGTPPPRDSDQTGAGQPGKENEGSGDSPKELVVSLGSDLSASYGKSASGHCSENDSRAGSESGTNSRSKKKKSTNWYNGLKLNEALSPTYKSRSMDFRKLFKDIPNDERLIVDYSCALQKDILVHGRLYLTQNWVCFYANIFRWETILTIKCKDISSMTKERTARVIPNAINIATRDEKYFFTSFGTRDKTYMMLFRVWQNALMDQPMSSQELWQWVHQMYGDELGLTSSDDDYVPPPSIDEFPLTLDSSTNSHDAKDGEEDSSAALNGESNTPSITSLEKTTTSNASLVTNSPEVSLTTNSNLATTPVSVNELNKAVTPDATSNDIPTDAGDTTEDSDGLQIEILCGDHDHDGFLAMDEIFQFSPDQLFDLLFSESEFYVEFIKSRKTFDLVMAPWPDEADADGVKSRIITYTLSLNYSFGPKVSPSTEKQTIQPDTKPGEIYVIDTEVVNGGVPYGENFYVINRFCITRVSSQKTRLRVHCSIKYRSKIWGLAKTFIEKNAKEGLLENYHLMAECLRREQEKLAYTAGQPTTTRKKVLRRRRTHNNPQGDASPAVRRRADSLRQHSQPGTPTRGVRRSDKLTISQEALIKVVCVVLIILMAVNVMLYYKLWALEGIANNVKYSQREFMSPPKAPLNTGDWAKLLEQQQDLHDEEIRRWKEILAASVQLVDHMKSTLSELYDSLERRSTMNNG